MRYIRQFEENMCGQCCVAMVADVVYPAACEAVGARVGIHSAGTHTRDIIRGLRKLGVRCADRARRVSRVKPALPRRAIVSIRDATRAHWMVTWDGVMYDPGGRWPDGYPGWTITSYLEIFT